MRKDVVAHLNIHLRTIIIKLIQCDVSISYLLFPTFGLSESVVQTHVYAHKKRCIIHAY